MSYNFPRQEVISSIEFDPSDFRCPKCGSDTLILHGHAQIAAIELMEKGIIVARTETESESGFDAQIVDCFKCEKTFVIRDAAAFILEKENLELKDENQDLREKITALGGTPDTSPMNGVGYRH